MLESVYAVEPFPGLDTRRELARKLNVSARQVQVWFQNKRQRERKISRSKGLFSTPGLPDTPAAAAAAAAAYAQQQHHQPHQPHQPHHQREQHATGGQTQLQDSVDAAAV